MGKRLLVPLQHAARESLRAHLDLFLWQYRRTGETVVRFGCDGEEAPCPALRERRSSSPGEPAAWEKGSCGPCCGGERGCSCPPVARRSCAAWRSTARGSPA